MLRRQQLKKSTTISTYLLKLLDSCNWMLWLSPLNLMLTLHLCFFHYPSHLAQRCWLKIFVVGSHLVLIFLNVCMQMVTLALMLSNILRLTSSELWPSSLERSLSWRKQCMFGQHLMTPYDKQLRYRILSYALNPLMLPYSHAFVFSCSCALVFLCSHTLCSRLFVFHLCTHNIVTFKE